MSWFYRLWVWFVGWLRSFRSRGGLPEARRDLSPAPRLPASTTPPAASAQRAYDVVHLADDPDELLPESVYAIGENGHLWHVVLLCPCGCGATIALNVLPDDSPRWTLHETPNGPTLSPSVWRTTGCRSHFILRRGEVIWCHGRPGDVSERE